jgi:hypothetical protein
VNKVLDASAMIAYVSAESGGADVAAFLSAVGIVCHAHVMNLV